MSERKRELKRRRHRAKKFEMVKRRLEKATASEKAHLAAKLRRLTIGSEGVIAAMGLQDR